MTRASLHPDLVERGELSAEKRQFDRGSIERLPALAALLGFVVVRAPRPSTDETRIAVEPEPESVILRDADSDLGR